MINGISYIDFIFPGLLMMSVIMASYSNTSSSFFGSKFNGSIEELLVSPMSSTKILIWFVISAILRGLIVGGLVIIAAMCMTEIRIFSFGHICIFLFLSSTLFALIGLLNGIFAKSFDDVAIIPNFIITPLIYLGGVFYSIHVLPPFWKNISEFNPILYMVNGLRYGFIGQSDINIFSAIIVLLIFIFVLVGINIFLIERWIGLKK